MKPASHLLGLLGFPLGHSVSREMQMAALAALGLPYTYELFEVSPEHFVEKLRSLQANAHFVGANVTIPHKEVAFSLCDQVDDASRVLGGVNVLLSQEGKLLGHNTDWQGFLDALVEWKVSLADRKGALILGAGGGGTCGGVCTAGERDCGCGV